MSLIHLVLSVMMEYFGVSSEYIDNVQRVATANTLAEVNAYVIASRVACSWYYKFGSVTGIKLFKID